MFKGRCEVLKKFWLMCSHLIPRQNIPGEPDLGEYVETMENVPLPVKNEEMSIEIDTEEAIVGEYMETSDNIPRNTDVKEEED